MQTKTQKPADEYFRKARETPGEFVAHVIALRFLLANQKNGVNQERTIASTADVFQSRFQTLQIQCEELPKF